VALWNANEGLHWKSAELLEFLNSHAVDIALLTETKLHPSKKWRLPGLDIIRNDREPRPDHHNAGGTAVLLRTHLKGHEIPQQGTSPLEVTAVKVDSP
jgi:hypothetical protein